MGSQTKHIIVILRLHDAVALPAGIFRMTNVTGSIILNTKQPVPFHPKVIVIRRLLMASHINMALQAVLPGLVRSIPDLNNIITF